MRLFSEVSEFQTYREVIEMRSKILFILLAMIFVFLVPGCSGRDNPMISSVSSHEKLSYDSVPAVFTDYSSDGSISGGMGALGLFQMHLDPSSLDGELTSLRRSSLEDVIEIVDITNFLELAPCTNCVKMRSVALDPDGNIVINIGIMHPFPAGDPSKPASGRNRADLHVFNVEGIVISNAPATTFTSIGQKAAGFRLVNADGYTGYLDSSIDSIYPTDATIHPYITHFDDYSAGNFNAANPMGFESVTTPPPSGNLVMPMGSDLNLQDYVFALDGPTDFIFAVGCTYALSAESKAMRFSPEYRCPQHNKKAASEVSLEIISNDLKGGNITSSALLEIRVVDISHGVAVGVGLDQMKSDSSVGSVSIEVPGVTSTPVVVPGGSPLSGTGHSPSDPLVYQATITNASGGAEGIYPGLIKVMDTYAPGQNSVPSLESKDGISRVDPGMSPMTGLFDISEFATYQVFDIEVAIDNIPPIVDSGVTGKAAPHVLMTETYKVTAHDLDLDPLTWSWTIIDKTTGLPVSGYNGVPGDGAGNLLVNWKTVGATVGHKYDIACTVSDLRSAPVPATTLAVTATNVLFQDNMESGEGSWLKQHGDTGGNAGWGIVVGGNDGHWWHSNNGTNYTTQPDCARLWTPQIKIPADASNCHVEFFHTVRGYFWSNTITQAGMMMASLDNGTTFDTTYKIPVLSGPQYGNWTYPYGSTYFHALCNGGCNYGGGGSSLCWGYPCWVNSDATNSTNVMDYSHYIGQTIRFGWLFACSIYSGAYYWAIDDVKVTADP